MDQTKKVPFYKRPIMIIPFIVMTVGIALWLLLSKTWPASSLLKLQADLFDGKYYPKATFAVLWIGIVIITFAVIAFIGWLKSLMNGNLKK